MKSNFSNLIRKKNGNLGSLSYGAFSSFIFLNNEMLLQNRGLKILAPIIINDSRKLLQSLRD
ncbi:hypothetical protein T06_3916 [Trichinella sp. T6]|nr:hypothetical protein T06_3916 [Trichinella sp. T6]